MHLIIYVVNKKKWFSSSSEIQQLQGVGFSGQYPLYRPGEYIHPLPQQSLIISNRDLQNQEYLLKNYSGQTN